MKEPYSVSIAIINGDNTDGGSIISADISGLPFVFQTLLQGGWTRENNNRRPNSFVTS